MSEYDAMDGDSLGVGGREGLDEPRLTASMAYSTWKTCPSGLGAG